MTKTGTIVKALQAVLLVTVLTPATVLAGPASNRQPAAQTQPAPSEAKHINRGLILTPAEASTNANAQRPVEIPAISAPQVEIPALPPRPDEGPTASNNNFSTAAGPAATTTAQTSSIVTLPALPQAATDAAASAKTNAPVATDAVTPPAPVAPVTPTPVIAPVTSAATTVPPPAPVATPAAATATAKVDPVTTSTNNASSTKTAQTMRRSRAHHYSNDNFNFGGFNVDTGNINRQFTKFFNRRDVKSILSQYGLN